MDFVEHPEALVFKGAWHRAKQGCLRHGAGHGHREVPLGHGFMYPTPRNWMPFRVPLRQPSQVANGSVIMFFE